MLLFQLSRFFLSILTAHVKKTVPELEIALQKVHELRGEDADDRSAVHTQQQITSSSCSVCVFVQ